MVLSGNGTHERETPWASHPGGGEGNPVPDWASYSPGPEAQESHDPLGCATAGTTPQPALRPSPGTASLDP